MATIQGGSVVWDLDVDSSKFEAGLKNAATEADELGTRLNRNSQQASSFAATATTAFTNIADGLQTILSRTALLAAGGSFGLGAMAKAAYDQVDAVQQATVAFNAYEKDGKKVNAVLSSLVKYAQSDMGVLFNRKDLFAAAQGLEIMGDKTEDLVSHVQIMSRSVGLGLSSWDNLSEIIGRVGSTGRLTGIDFDNLTKAGFRLNDNLRNTDITFSDLFKNLDKGIPADAMAGQVNTIQGGMIRLQTAFRNLGNQLLDVDAKTSQFAAGGLGDTLIKGVGQITEAFKGAGIKKALADIGTSLNSVAKVGIPALITGFTWFLTNLPTITAGFASLASALVSFRILAVIVPLVSTFVAALSSGATVGGALLLALGGPITLIGIAIVALIAGLVFLQLRFNIFGTAIAFIGGLLTGLGAFFVTLWQTIQTTFIAGWNAVVGFFTVSIPGFVISFITFLSQLPGMIMSFVWNNIILGTVSFLGLLTGLIVFGIPVLIKTIVNFFIALPGMLWSILLSIYNFFVSAWNNIYSFATVTVPAIVGDIVKWVSQLPGQIAISMETLLNTFVTGFQNIWSSIVGEVSQWPGQLYNWGVTLMHSFADGIKSAIGAIADAFKAGMNNARKLVEGHSPPLEGPFKDIGKWGFNVGKAWTDGLSSAVSQLTLPNLQSTFTLPDTMSPGYGSSGTPALATTGGSSGGVHVHVGTMNVAKPSDSTDVARDLAFRIETSPGYVRST